MFDQLFCRSDALTRQLSAPLVEERRQYLAQCLAQGYPSSPRGRGHQHNPCLAGARLAQHYKRLRGSRSRDEGQSARNLRDPRGCSPKALEGGRRTDAVPAKPLMAEFHSSSSTSFFGMPDD